MCTASLRVTLTRICYIVPGLEYNGTDGGGDDGQGGDGGRASHVTLQRHPRGEAAAGCGGGRRQGDDDGGAWRGGAGGHAGPKRPGRQLQQMEGS